MKRAQKLSEPVISNFDRRLLALLQENNQLTCAALGEQLGLSPSACFRRQKRLEASGVIEANIAVLAPEKVGRPLVMIVNVTLERERPDIIDNFKRAMRATPEVMQCFYVTGDSDFMLVVTAKNMADYESFTKRFFIDSPNIRRFHTSVVMDRVKMGLALPIEE